MQQRKGRKTKEKVNFLYRKRLNTVILPCDEIIWYSQEFVIKNEYRNILPERKLMIAGP